MPDAQRPIVTLTVNPALDVSTSTPHVVASHKLRCTATVLDPGGGGVNVSRVVHRLGGQSVAVYTSGGPTGDAYRQLLNAEGVVSRVIGIAGSTRESFTVDETSSGDQYRFVLEGPWMAQPEWRECLEAAQSLVAPGGFLVASGSLPPGAPDDLYAQLARIAKAAGADCVIDASGSALRHALDEGVTLIKPSLRELGELTGQALETPESQLAAAKHLVDSGNVQYVALTLGADGAMLVGADEELRMQSPQIEVRSTVGSGDSFLAAFVLRLAQHRTVAEAFRAGVAAGSATAMTAATDLCRREDVERLEAELAG